MYITLTRRRMLCLLLTVVLGGLIVCVFLKVSADGIDGSTDAARRGFADSLGCTVGSASEKEIIIPAEFSDVYIKYNDIQKAAGFDLSSYKGCRVKLYTFSGVTYPGCREETQLNLIVYHGKIIGGDISQTAIDGEMLPLTDVKNAGSENGKAKIG